MIEPPEARHHRRHRGADNGSFKGCKEDSEQQSGRNEQTSARRERDRVRRWTLRSHLTILPRRAFADCHSLRTQPFRFQGSSIVTTTVEDACAPALSVIVKTTSNVPRLPNTCDPAGDVDFCWLVSSPHCHEYSTIRPFGDAEPPPPKVTGCPT